MTHSLTALARERGHSDPLPLVADALRRNDGSPAKAAAALGVSESAIRYWMNGRIRVSRRWVVKVEIVETKS